MLRKTALAALLFLPLALAESQPKPIVIHGTGNLTSVNVRTSTPLYPACVSQIDRVGSIQLTGVITTSVEANGYMSRALRDDCATPSSVVGLSTQRYEIQKATIAGRTGRILIEAQGPFEGDAATPPGTRIRLHWKIIGLDGDLKGMEGEGMSAGIATAFTGQPAAANTTYIVTLTLKK
jgi:hypothetical protein